MNSKRMVIALLTVASLMLAPMAAFSADEPESNLARMWVVKPKPGMDQELEDAMKAHNAWRVENKDPWGWNTYHRVTGAVSICGLSSGDTLIRSLMPMAPVFQRLCALAGTVAFRYRPLAACARVCRTKPAVATPLPASIVMATIC